MMKQLVDHRLGARAGGVQHRPGLRPARDAVPAAAGPFVAANSPAVQPLAPVAGRLVAALRRPGPRRARSPTRSPHNTDVRAAVARLARARAALREVKVDRLPARSASAPAAIARTATPASDATPPTSFDAGLDVAYEVDLFGRVSRSVEAAPRRRRRRRGGCRRGPRRDRRRYRASLCRRRQRGRAAGGRDAHRRAARPLARSDPARGRDRRRRPRLDTARIAALREPATGRDSGHRRRARRGAVPAGDC